jgi:hypothetical protein
VQGGLRTSSQWLGLPWLARLGGSAFGDLEDLQGRKRSEMCGEREQKAGVVKRSRRLFDCLLVGEAYEGGDEGGGPAQWPCTESLPVGLLRCD